MPFVSRNGVRLHYQSYGTGFPLVFAHGRGGNLLSWWQQIPFFLRKYRCIAIDQREFGLSVDAPDGPGRHAHVDDLRHVLDHLEIKNTNLIGQSMGGGTCLGFAVAHPERVQAMVLADTSGGISDPDLLADFRIRAPHLPQQAGERALSLRFREQQPDKAFLYAALGEIARPPREKFVDFMTDSSGPDIQQLSRIKTPTLVIVGAEDVVITPENAATLAKRIPDAQLETVPEAGHSVYFEKPDVFNALVDTFLTQFGQP
jgi:3-oxoadipate enol-lactonase